MAGESDAVFVGCAQRRHEVWRRHLMNVNGACRIYFNAGDNQAGVEEIFLAKPQ